jgi:hypothetical protein
MKFSLSSRVEHGNVDMRALLTSLNWRETPIPNPKTGDLEERLDDLKLFESTTLERQNLKVNYNALIEELQK